MIKLKDSVRPRNLVILAAAANVFHTLIDGPADLVVTSGNDSRHMTGSKHYLGNALDFRTKTFTAAAKRLFKKRLAERLGGDYDLVLEDEAGPNEHLHVEYDPPIAKVVAAKTVKAAKSKSRSVSAGLAGRARRSSRARVSRAK